METNEGTETSSPCSKMGMLMQNEHLLPAVLVFERVLCGQKGDDKICMLLPSGSLRNVGMLAERKHFHLSAVLVAGVSLEWYDC